MEKRIKVLVVAPHGDDEVLGCGGTIAKHIDKGDEVFLCIVTKTWLPKWTQEYIDNRKIETKNSCRELGIKHSICLGINSTTLDSIQIAEISEKMTTIVKEINPDILYIPFYGDMHRDHRVVFEACLVASRPFKNRIKRVLCYETVTETECGIYPFNPNIYIDITGYIEKKTNAMKCYSSELFQPPHRRSIEGIITVAKNRGYEANTNYAEAFFLIRELL
jgi:LmbE family N-acetylglucosaminyl deacetylase